MNLPDDVSWLSHEVTGAYLKKKAAWLGEKRNLHSGSLRFFEESGKLVLFSRYHYPLASVAFFHAIPGLERALKLHYKDEEAALGDLLLRALNDQVICDARLTHQRPFTKEFLGMVEELIEDKYDSHAELFARLVPKLRNQYFHGTYLLAPDYLHLTFQLREIADALNTRATGRPV